MPDVSPDTSPKYPPKHAPVHDATPTAAVLPYRPALQFVHVPAAARLYCPAGHVTWVALMDPAGHAYPAVQFPEHAAVASADTFPKVPGGHKVHTAAPTKEYCPAAHATWVADVEPAGHA